MGRHWEESEESYKQVYEKPSHKHEAKLSHELIASAAALAGFHIFESRQRKVGKPISHATAKEILVALVAAEVDKLAEHRVLNEYDHLKAKNKAKKQVEEMYEDHYEDEGDVGEYDPRRVEAPEAVREGRRHHHHHGHREDE